MAFYQNKSATDQVKKMLKQRGMCDREKALSLRHSNGRATRLKNLSHVEIQNVLNAFNEFTDESVLKAIYDTAAGLHIISDTTPTISNDEIIIAYLKAKSIIDLVTNEIEVVNPVEKIKIISPFSNLKFVEKELILSLLGNCIVEYYAKNN